MNPIRHFIQNNNHRQFFSASDRIDLLKNRQLPSSYLTSNIHYAIQLAFTYRNHTESFLLAFLLHQQYLYCCLIEKHTHAFFSRLNSFDVCFDKINEEVPAVKDSWKIIESFLSGHGLVLFVFADGPCLSFIEVFEAKVFRLYDEVARWWYRNRYYNRRTIYWLLKIIPACKYNWNDLYWFSILLNSLLFARVS